MDAEHRHELKTNELADFMGRFPEWLKENSRTIIGVALIIAAVVVFFYSKRMKTDAAITEKAEATGILQSLTLDQMKVLQAARDSDVPSDVLAMAANRMGMAAENVSLPYSEAMLLIKKGQALRADLHYKAEEVDAATIADVVKQATQAYQAALTKAKGNATLEAMATFGLGLCAEEGGDYDKAKELYASIVDNADFAGTVFPVQARQRIDGMADNRAKFVFVKAPELEPKPTTPGFTMPPGMEVTPPKIEVPKPAEATIIEPETEPAKEPETESAKEPETVEVGSTEEPEKN